MLRKFCPSCYLQCFFRRIWRESISYPNPTWTLIWKSLYVCISAWIEYLLSYSYTYVHEIHISKMQWNIIFYNIVQGNIQICTTLYWRHIQSTPVMSHPPITKGSITLRPYHPRIDTQPSNQTAHRIGFACRTFMIHDWKTIVRIQYQSQAIVKSLQTLTKSNQYCWEEEGAYVDWFDTIGKICVPECCTIMIVLEILMLLGWG